jgi:hypothetical protein
MRALPVLAVVGFLIWLWCHPLGLIGVIIAELVLGFSQEFLYAIRQVCFQTSNIKGPISENRSAFLLFILPISPTKKRPISPRETISNCRIKF